MLITTKLSTLLNDSMAALRQCESSPDFEVNMNWYLIKRDEKCLVCLAGAYANKRFGILPKYKGSCLLPQDVAREADEPVLANWLRAINAAREGDVHTALLHLYGFHSSEVHRWLEKYPSSIEIADYHDDREAFYHNMAHLIKNLIALDL